MAERMKESGNQWIGEIPESWNINRVLNLLDMPVTDGPHTTPDMEDDGVLFVSAEAVSFGKGKIDFDHIWGYISEEFYKECCKKYIPELNDIYMIKSGATTGRVAIVDSINPKFTIWSPLAVFRCNMDKMIPEFMFYSLQADYFQMQIQLGWTYGTQQNIGMRTLEHLKICEPPLKEQLAIADFLDKRCAQIDDVIADLEEQIILIRATVDSKIHEIVTRGLNQVEFRTTRISWASSIPNKWKETKVKYICFMKSGDNLVAEDIETDGDYPVYGGNGIRGYYDRYSNDGEYVIIGRQGALAGNVHLVEGRFWATDHAVVVYPNNSIDNCYLSYLFYDMNLNQYAFETSAQPGLAVSKIMNLDIVLPASKEEQMEISKYLNNYSRSMGDIIIEKERQLQELKEYKKSLIYEYVTGKKRVKEVDTYAN